MTARQLVFADGKSNKFWNIVREGSTHTVTFGRAGTAGQTRAKSFDDDAACQKSFEKLIQQKMAKGYVDAGGGGGAAAAPASAGKTAAKKTATNKTIKKKTAAAAAESAAEPVAVAVDDAGVLTQPELNVTHEIDLAPTDWSMASFRERKPLPQPGPREADLDAAEKKLATLKTKQYGWELSYESLPLGPHLPAPEAQLYLEAMIGAPGRLAGKKAVAAYAAKTRKGCKCDGEVDFETIRKRVFKTSRGVSAAIMGPLAALFTPEQCLEIALTPCPEDAKKYISRGEVTLALSEGFRDYVLPYLSKSQITTLRKRVRKTFDPAAEVTDAYGTYPAEHYVAAILGMHKEVYAVVSAWPDNHLSQHEGWIDHYLRPQMLLFGLSDAATVEAEWRRLKIRLNSAQEARGFLACTEYSALDVLASEVCAQSNKDYCLELLEVLCLVRAPEAAEPLLRCRLEAKMPAPARDWLNHQVGNAVAGLIPTAANKGKLGEAAIEYLRGVKRNGQQAVIVKALKEAGESAPGVAQVQREVIEHEEKVYEAFTTRSTPRWLKDALAEVAIAKPPRLPAWADAASLPPLVVGEKRLDDQQIQTVLSVLATTPITERHPLLQTLRQHADKASRDAFAWQLFRYWQEDGAAAKHKWAMGAIGHLGDDGCVLKLTPLVRAWPGESQHARAVFGLECLRAVGSSVALMQLSGIAQKLKFKGLKSKAAAFVEQIAEEKGMTRAELEDRVIPDCGLDETGRREFSFGPRSFWFVLGGDLKPMVRDEAGKVRPNMPKPGVKDDANVAEQSLSEWKLIKKQIKDVATLQAARLEQAMVTGRRWAVADFESLLVRHPLMTHLVQKLIWAGYDAKGKRKRLFRVTEERDYADVEDEQATLDDVRQVGVVHPLDMTAKERSAWGEVLSDYEIIAPFPQLGRDIYELENGEPRSKELERFHGLKLAAPTMVFTLEKLGWVRGEAMDAGCFDEHSKQFPSADVTAVVHYDGVVGMGYIDPDEMLSTESIHFCQGMRGPSGYGWGSKKTMKLGDVPAIVISEVIADLQIIKSKAK
ncbi:WGR and DUF4132 domain-containing protein [Roseimaritima sediminicola]|uniref:WGR and DUF4132 domain-containing protein n=1 Tax=Roseimaritima sediminicola TaxID=2662066 RepID=UPI0012985375|nr:DUF4132 domain-containing protein [Roseimaritima sediminicola]